MRKVERRKLDARAASYLSKRQRGVDQGAEVQAAWKAARRTSALRRVAEVLRAMAGAAERCMFCGDSRGGDVEHFWPKSKFPQRSFQWPNLLWACAVCNRIKSDRFPLDESGTPLLIDPTLEDPWDHLVFEPLTGLLAARVSPANGTPDRKGVATVHPDNLPINDRAVVIGRKRALTILESALVRFQASKRPEADIDELLRAFRGNHFGLAAWQIRREGRDEARFAAFRREEPAVWRRLEQLDFHE